MGYCNSSLTHKLVWDHNLLLQPELIWTWIIMFTMKYYKNYKIVPLCISASIWTYEQLCFCTTRNTTYPVEDDESASGAARQGIREVTWTRSSTYHDLITYTMLTVCYFLFSYFGPLVIAFLKLDSRGEDPISFSKIKNESISNNLVPPNNQSKSDIQM